MAQADAAGIGPSSSSDQTRATLLLFWSVARGTPWRLALSLILPVLTVLAAGFVGPLLIAELLGRIQTGGVTLADSAGLIAGYAGSQVFGQVVGWRITLYVMWTAVLRGMRDLYQRVFDHLTTQSMSFHADRFSGALVSQANKLTGAYDLLGETVVWQVIPVLTTVVAAVVILASSCGSTPCSWR